MNQRGPIKGEKGFVIPYPYRFHTDTSDTHTLEKWKKVLIKYT